MSKFLVEGEEQSKAIQLLISECSDFETCFNLSTKYYCNVYPSCNHVITNKLFEFCFEKGIIIAERARSYCSLDQRARALNLPGYFPRHVDYRVQYFMSVFHKFGGKLYGPDSEIDAYNKRGDWEKHVYVVQETKNHFKKLKEYFQARYLYLDIVDKFPELKDMMIETLYNLCYDDEKGLWGPYGSNFISLVGKEHPLAKKILNSFLRHTVIGFVSSLVICVGSILIATKLPVPGWSMFILIPCMLGFGLRGIQYFFKVFSAIANYGKDTDFNLNTGIFAYTKVRHFEEVHSPLRK